MPAHNTRDLAGLRFGRMVALRQVGHRKFPSGGSHAIWQCVCDCGAMHECVGTSLLAGHTRSCGCLRKVQPTNVKHGHARAGAKSPTFKLWASVQNRKAGVHPRWLVFSNFLADMGERPDGLELDRIDNAKPYGPGNCRWATRAQQMRNRTNTVFVEHERRRLPLVDLAELVGLPTNTLRLRHRKGERGAQLVRPLQKQRGGRLVRTTEA